MMNAIVKDIDGLLRLSTFVFQGSHSNLVHIINSLLHLRRFEFRHNSSLNHIISGVIRDLGSLLHFSRFVLRGSNSRSLIHIISAIGDLWGTDCPSHPWTAPGNCQIGARC